MWNNFIYWLFEIRNSCFLRWFRFLFFLYFFNRNILYIIFICRFTNFFYFFSHTIIWNMTINLLFSLLSNFFDLFPHILNILSHLIFYRIIYLIYFLFLYLIFHLFIWFYHYLFIHILRMVIYFYFDICMSFTWWGLFLFWVRWRFCFCVDGSNLRWLPI